MAMKRTLLLVALTVALVGTACGGGETVSDTSNSAAATAEPAEPVDQADDAARAQTEDAPSPQATAAFEPVIDSDSPIENLLGIPLFDDGAMQKWFESLSREAEVVIAECMLTQGFEYSPNSIRVISADEEFGTDSLEYAQASGFGIVSGFDKFAFDPATASSDKNGDYVASLTDGERDAYFVALTGATEGEQVDTGFGEGGCQGEAEGEVFAVVGTLEAISPVFEGYVDLYFSDSRILETTKQWQACMAEDGYLFDDEDDAFDSVQDRFEAIVGQPDAFNQVDAAVDLGDSHPGLTPAARVEMDALAVDEVMIAVANWTCREPIKDTELAVQREYENQFVAEVGPQVQALQGGG